MDNKIDYNKLTKSDMLELQKIMFKEIPKIDPQKQVMMLFPYRIQGFLGLPGAGKSLLMVYTAWVYHQVFPWMKVLTNIPLYNFDNDRVIELTDMQQVEDMQKCIVVWDELLQSEDGRQWENNSLGSILLKCIRKSGSILLYTDQLFQVDIRIRKATQLLVVGIHDYSKHIYEYEFYKNPYAKDNLGDIADAGYFNRKVFDENLMSLFYALYDTTANPYEIAKPKKGRFN